LRKPESNKRGCDNRMLSNNLLVHYDKVASQNEGKWFALMPNGELVAVAKNSRSLWKKIRKKLDKKIIEETDLMIGYSQTKEERETACLLPALSITVV
jgi:hypothetical protein